MGIPVRGMGPSEGIPVLGVVPSIGIPVRGVVPFIGVPVRGAVPFMGIPVRGMISSEGIPVLGVVSSEGIPVRGAVRSVLSVLGWVVPADKVLGLGAVLLFCHLFALSVTVMLLASGLVSRLGIETHFSDVFSSFIREFFMSPSDLDI